MVLPVTVGYQSSFTGLQEDHLETKACRGFVLANGSYNSVHREIVSDWKIESGKFLYHVNTGKHDSNAIHSIKQRYG
jgi:hypothetical protein